MRIGIDFDNTIAGYDHVFLGEARRRGLVDASFGGTKTEIRDHIMSGSDGERRWMEIQGAVYGRLMEQATVIDGVADFLDRCRAKEIEVFIVSHKTRFGHFDPDRIDLRDAARRWMLDKRITADDGGAVDESNVYFEDTRGEKVARIGALNLSVFVDDLKEVFLEPGFPEGVERYLLADPRGPLPDGPFKACRGWPQITERVFGDA